MPVVKAIKIKIKYVSIFVLVATITANVFAATPEPLNQLKSVTLQTRLKANIESNSVWKRLVKQKKMSACVVDLNNPTPEFAAVNGDQMMYAASLPKIAILLAAYVSFEDGSLIETPELREDLTQMIRVSSNAAATRMIDRIGFAKIQMILQDPQYQFYDKSNDGGLWVGKRYAAKGVRKGDPLYNISHGATANQVCRFFYLLSTKQLINERRSEQMLNDLSDPSIHHKFVSQIDRLAPKASVYRKSGSWRHWHADAMLVKGIRWREYILVGLVEHQSGEQILRKLVPTVESIIRPEPKSQPKK